MRAEESEKMAREKSLVEEFFRIHKSIEQMKLQFYSIDEMKELLSIVR